MKLTEFNCADSPGHPESLFGLFQRRELDACVVRNFIGPGTVQRLIGLYETNVEHGHPVFDGFRSLPRPFDHIPGTRPECYSSETETYVRAMSESGLEDLLLERFRSVSADHAITLNKGNLPGLGSGTWSSFKELTPGKGSFEIHCGRLFQPWNREFFDSFARIADVNDQLAFLIVLERPDTMPCDIEIFDVSWEEVHLKVDSGNLQRRDGTLMPVDGIPSEKVILREGDLLIFDEGNLWHRVPPFQGDRRRLSFGGFITSAVKGQEVIFWI